MTTLSSQPTRARRESGFGLVEIMIAMTLDLFVLGGLYEVFLGSKATYRTQAALSRMQENARYAVSVLFRDIRMAGFTGCASLEAMAPVNIIAQTSAAFGRDQYVGGSNDVTTRNTTDTLLLRGATAHGVPLIGNASGSSLNIASNPENIKKNSLVIIADCRDADIFKVTNDPGNGNPSQLTHADSANTTNQLSKAYQQGALVSKFEARAYQIGNDPTATFSDGTPVPVLYQIINDGDPVEPVQGVQDMQIQYGVNSGRDSRHSADEYDNATKVTADNNWPYVVSVRVALLMGSLANAADGPSSRTYTLLDAAPVGPFDDRRLRRTKSGSYGWRNTSSLSWADPRNHFVGFNADNHFSPNNHVFNVNPSGNTREWARYRHATPIGDEFWPVQETIPPLPAYAFARSADYNVMYFNPALTYKPWIKADGTYYPDSAFTSASSDPAVSSSKKINLTKPFRSLPLTIKLAMIIPAGTVIQFAGRNGWETLSKDFSPSQGDKNIGIEYFIPTFWLDSPDELPVGYGYNAKPLCGVKPFAKWSLGTDCQSNPDRMYGYEIKPGNFLDGDYGPAIQNFANWFTYHRNRSLAARAAIARVFRTKYYKNDLRPDLSTNVSKADLTQHLPVGCLNSDGSLESSPSLVLDCKLKPHMPLFGVTIGKLKRTLYAANESATQNPFGQIKGRAFWPRSYPAYNPQAIDDFWHATLDTHGKLLSTNDPNQIADKLTQVITSIFQQSHTAASVAASSTQLQTGSMLYQGLFSSGKWSGNLAPYGVDKDTGEIADNPTWVASEKLPQAYYRHIFTLAGGRGAIFQWPNLSIREKIALDIPTGNQNDGWTLSAEQIRDLLQNGGRTAPRQTLRGRTAQGLRPWRARQRHFCPPSGEPCKAGGDSYLVELNAFNGGRLGFPPFDLNGDRQFSQGDAVSYTASDGQTVTAFASALKSKVGIAGAPTIVSLAGSGNGQSANEIKYLNGSSGRMQTVSESPGPSKGVQSWRQLR